MLLIFSEFTIHLIYSRIGVYACIVIVTLSSVLVGSLYILSMREEERGRKVVSRDKPRFADETRERGEKEAGGLKKSVKGTGAGQGIINARVSLTSVGQKSSSGPCLAIERPPGIHRHGDRCVKTISCSPGTLSRLLLSNDSLARLFRDQEREKSCMCKFSRAVSCNFQESYSSRTVVAKSKCLYFDCMRAFIPRRLLNIIININRETRIHACL